MRMIPGSFVHCWCFCQCTATSRNPQTDSSKVLWPPGACGEGEETHGKRIHRAPRPVVLWTKGDILIGLFLYVFNFLFRIFLFYLVARTISSEDFSKFLGWGWDQGHGGAVSHSLTNLTTPLISASIFDTMFRNYIKKNILNPLSTSWLVYCVFNRQL